jgi:hypothetical protein
MIEAASKDPLESRKRKNNMIWSLALVSKRFHVIVDNSRPVLVKVNVEDGCALIGKEAPSSCIGFNLAVATNKADRQLVKSKIHECRHLWLSESLEQHDIKYVQNPFLQPIILLTLFDRTTATQDWSFPKLKHLVIDRALSPEFVPLFSNLTRLEMEGDAIDWSSLATTLQSATFLVVLILDFGGDELSSKAIEGLQEISLPLLEVLSISCNDNDKGCYECNSLPLLVDLFTEKLRVPALRSFSTHFKYEDLSSFTKYNPSFFPQDLPMDNVQEVSFSITGTHIRVQSKEAYKCESYTWAQEERDREEDYVKEVQTEVADFIPLFLSRFPSAKSFTLRASRYTEDVTFESMMKLQELHVYGGYDAVSFLPKIIDTLAETEDRNLREVYLHIRHDLKAINYPDEDSKRKECVPRLLTKLVLEQVVGKTVISVLETSVEK